MATSDNNWPHRPINPDLCLVCDDMIAIVQDLLDEDGPTIDTTGPAVVAEATPAPNEHGWNNEAVVVQLAAQDERGGSGVREILTTLSGAQQGGQTRPGGTVTETVNAEGETSLAYHAIDNAGNPGTPQTLDLNIDLTAPDLSTVTDPPANASGWHRTAVRVSFHAADALSGVATVPADVEVTAEGAAQDVIGTAEDRAGNVATASATINLDKTTPSIEIAAPADGAVYLLNQPVSADFSCADGLSGIANCTGTVARGAAIDTARAGTRPFMVVAADVADNLGDRSAAYKVRYGILGFPEGTSLIRARPGRTLPVKWLLFDATRAPVVNAGAVLSMASHPVACDTLTPIGPATPAAGNLQVDPMKGRYQFAWRTESGWEGCRIMELTLDDGSTHRAGFDFRAKRK
jgi:hypothetical protein